MAIFGTGKLPKTGDPGQVGGPSNIGATSRVNAARQGTNSATKSSKKTSSRVGAKLAALARKRKLLNSDQQATPGGVSPVNIGTALGDPAQKTVGAWPAGKKFGGF